MTEKQKWYKRPKVWGIIVAAILFMSVVGNIIGPPEDVSQSNQAEQQDTVQIPDYEVLDETESITGEGVSAHVLIDEGMSIAPDDMLTIAKHIADEQDFYKVSLYHTVESYEVNVSIKVSDENKEALEATGGLEENQEYVPADEHERMLNEGYIGSYEDEAITNSGSSDYYEKYQEYFDEKVDNVPAVN